MRKIFIANVFNLIAIVYLYLLETSKQNLITHNNLQMDVVIVMVIPLFTAFLFRSFGSVVHIINIDNF